jgi:hypothetical protein
VVVLQVLGQRLPCIERDEMFVIGSRANPVHAQDVAALVERRCPYGTPLDGRPVPPPEPRQADCLSRRGGEFSG